MTGVFVPNSKVDPDEWELISDSEPPLGIREFDKALSGHLPRGMRGKVYRAMKEAGLLVFHA